MEAWQPVALDTEFAPEVAALLVSDRGRRELSSLLRSRDEVLRTKVRKHLLAIGWTMASRRNAAMAPRLRYEYDGKTYVSLPDLIIDPRLRFEYDGKTYVSLPDLIIDHAGTDTADTDDDEADGGLLENNPPPPTETGDEPEPGSQDAIAEYVALMAASHDRRAKGPRADRLRANAKRHLQASGWTFWMKLKSDGREELRYKAPTGRSYISLHTACQAFMTQQSTTTCSRKKRKISELLQDSPVIKECTTITIEKKKKTSSQAVVNGACLIQKSTTTITTVSKRKKKKAAGSASSGQARVLRPNHEAARRVRTLLSVLIDEDILVPRDKVTYRAAGGGAPAKDGMITGDGVRCTCCGRAFTVEEFEAHATRGTRTGRPWARLFLKDGRSLSQCLVELMRRDLGSRNNGNASGRLMMPRAVRVKEECLDRDGDTVCSICNDGGELLLCDQCPSAFHHDCLGLPAAILETAGNWFCPCCRCGVCGGSDADTNTNRPFTDRTIVYCEQCEREYHVGCVRDRGGDPQPQQGHGPWVCSPRCGMVFQHLQGIAGRSIPTSAEGVSLVILRRSLHGDGDEEAAAEEHGKLRAALDVLHECFVPLVEPCTRSDLSDDIVFNRESELRRLHFRGYHVVGLEKGGELVTVATLRVYGNKVAELPLVGTRFAHRRQGMLHLLMRELEKMLSHEEMGVERLVLPAVPELLQMWTGSLGFKAMTSSDKLEIAEHTILCFQGTTMCQKFLPQQQINDSSQPFR